ncbi:MAG: hypothetical protein WBA05_15760 [Gordonia sp. (in: high G+C Gram-positive bacteria)]|uniref:hypothetical protein n=1 Tax=Gordonia sp. (in: high G+C Gram-positive bacteria) TaxID=84139 RepID=UPI003C751C0B
MGSTTSDDRLKQWRQARRELRAARDDLTDAEISAGLRTRMSTRLIAVLGAVVAACVIVAAVAVWYAASAPSRFSDEDYVAAATSRVDLLLNVDADDPARAKRILDGATGAFHDAFAQSADAYSTYVKDTGARGHGSVDAAAVQYRSDAGADVMVAANVQVGDEKSDADAQPIKPLRLIVGMVPDGGVLKIDGLVLVP